jgi:alcohol dehydrogenase (NADP+)
MIQAQGYAAQQAKAPLRQYSFERRDPRNYDVVVDIQYCGICHTDVHQVNDEWGGSIFPMVPGHEIVGIVTKVSAKVSRYKLGDRVGVGCLVDSCRQCSHCLNGLEQYCIEGQTMTYNGIERDGQTRTQGGYSNKIVVDENYVLRIPDNRSRWVRSHESQDRTCIRRRSQCAKSLNKKARRSQEDGSK